MGSRNIAILLHFMPSKGLAICREDGDKCTSSAHSTLEHANATATGLLRPFTSQAFASHLMQLQTLTRLRSHLYAAVAIIA